jgi:hypothetical protein
VAETSSLQKFLTPAFYRRRQGKVRSETALTREQFQTEVYASAPLIMTSKCLMLHTSTHGAGISRRAATVKSKHPLELVEAAVPAVLVVFDAFDARQILVGETHFR